MAVQYRERNQSVYDAFSDVSKEELLVTVKLMLALLRELHPKFFVMEHLHGVVESLGQRARLRNRPQHQPKVSNESLQLHYQS